MMRPFGLPVVDDDAESILLAGCRVRVNAGKFGGIGVVKVPATTPYSRVSVEFDDEPGTWWQFARDEVIPL